MTTTVPMPGSVSVESCVYALGDTTRLTVGAALDNDIVVDHRDVREYHLAIEWRDDTWHLVSVDGATLVVSGALVVDFPITSTTSVHLGPPASAPILVVALATEEVEHGSHSDRPSVTLIGRGPTNDLAVDDVLVSRRHARLVVGPGERHLEDLGSVNGTFVNGHRIFGRAAVTDGDLVTVGNTDLIVRGGDLLAAGISAVGSNASWGGLQVESIGLVVDRTKELLHDVDLVAGPGKLTALVGPSGAGKSTLSKIVAGLTAPTSGRVLFDGHDVHAEYESPRTRIGMVPQHDVLHRKLTLRQALRFAAELRLPEDLPESERDRVIAGVLDELQLSEHLDTRVDALSGGQRKRASVAMELLTGPSLLILDEPTSGLDPALDRQVMTTLRRLADAGRTVIVVTHSLTHLAKCDQVLLLAPGGKTAFRGRPDEVAPAMGNGDWAEIFSYVASHPDDAYRRHLARTNGHASHRHQSTPSTRVVRTSPQTSAQRQASTIARRQLRLILADPGYLAFLVVMPLVLGLLTLVIPGSAGFGVNTAQDTAGESLQVLVILVIGACFMGTALTVRDLVGERDIFERERAVGLRPGSYLTAKVGVYFGVAIAQSTTMVVICYLGKGLPSGGVVGAAPVELLGAVAAIACVSAVVGLAISATVKSNEQTMPPLVILVISQLVFCGGLFRLSAPGLSQLAWLFPSYWGYAASAMAVDLPSIAPLAPQTRGAHLWEPAFGNALLTASALTLLGVLLIAYTASKLQLKR
ncbi:ATP-binding cassette domain-containing protein [Gordonia sputi]